MTGPEDPRALVGAVLNKQLRLVSVLGEGGLGVVYRGELLSGGEVRAVKLLRKEFRGDAEVVERFLSEAALAERIQHAGVVRVYGAHRAEDGTPYLVSELLRGQALSVSMNRGPTRVGEAARIVQELLDALAAAHAVGVVHRDLKPDNVFLEPGEPSKVRLLDFGMSRAVEAAGGSARRTKTGMLLGTPGYMSPEQVRNSKDADERSDLFSMGVLFFELMTGQRAFEGGTEYERMMAVLFADARPIEKVAPQFAHWQPFFNKALHRDAASRFQSAREMRDALVSVAESGQMPKQRFGGDATALSPMGSEFPPADARKSPPVEMVLLPRSLPLLWVGIWVLAAALLGFLLGFWLGGA